MGDARKPTALDDQDKKLDPQNFAYISDDTYTAVEVEAQTQVGAGASRCSRPCACWGGRERGSALRHRAFCQAADGNWQQAVGSSRVAISLRGS